MKRKITDKLLQWKLHNAHLPLVLQGARQVGKTYSILEFGEKYYKNCVYFNFEDNTALAQIFERDLNPERIIKGLEDLSEQKIYKEDTLIFFDEVQTCERALTSLKYFAEKALGYHLIAAGSLLGVAINRERYSFPVGKVSFMTLYPLDFEEFLWALKQESLAASIREHFNNNEEMFSHARAMDYYRMYLVVGGMPAAVRQYLEKNNTDYVLAVQKSILDAYVADMAKYASYQEAVKIRAAFDSLVAQLAKENKRFQYKVIKTGARAYDYEVPLAWLQLSGIVNKIIKVTEGKLPLKAFTENAAFKLYYLDTGLLCSALAVPASKVLSEMEELNPYKGVLAENYVAFALLSNGYTPYYWESKGIAEVDFVIQDKEGNIVPIEVKAAEHVRSKSLNSFVKKYAPNYCIRVSSKNFGFFNNIKAVPFYAAFCL